MKKLPLACLLVPASLALLVSASAAQAAAVRTKAASTKGLVVTYLWYALHEGDDDCPTGPAIGMRRLEYPALAKLPAAERERLARPENKQELMSVLQAFALGGSVYNSADVTKYLIGPNLAKNVPKGERALNAGGVYNQGVNDQCFFPKAFEAPPQRIAQGRIGEGLDLDQGGGACPHDEFTSPTGQGGIDNQLARVVGCVDGYRHKAEFSPATTEAWAQGARIDGVTTLLIEITGIDDERNDPDVEVTIWESGEATPYDARTKGMDDYSLTAREVQAGVPNRAHGRIENGVLKTDATDLVLPFRAQTGAFPLPLRGARFELTFAKDGSAQGLLGTYFDIDAIYHHETTNRGRFVTTSMAMVDLNCTSYYNALVDLADGGRDPKTGQCTTISGAYRVEAVPAFVIHPPAGVSQTAERKAP